MSYDRYGRPEMRSEAALRKSVTTYSDSPRVIEPIWAGSSDIIRTASRRNPVSRFFRLFRLRANKRRTSNDGNGRVGRLLITFLLHESGVLREPTLYLSLYLKRKREDYYRLLNQVRQDGEWEESIEFFLRGVVETATGAVTTARKLLDVFEADKTIVDGTGRAAGVALRILELARKRPLLAAKSVSESLSISLPTALSGLRNLKSGGILDESPGESES